MTTYKHNRTSTPGRVPTSSQILEGEIAINLPDKKLFTKSGNEVIELGGGGSSGSGGLRFKRIFDANGYSTWFAECTKGKLWAWGRSDEYSMGQGVGSGSTGYSGFRMISLPYRTKEFIGFVAIVNTCFATLRDRKSGKYELWTWGRNNYGLCGVGTTAHVPMPAFCSELYDENSFIYPKTGANYGWSTMVYIRKPDGEYYGFGRNWQGRLGNGVTSQINSPTKIGYPAGYDKTDVKKIWALGMDYGVTFIIFNDNTMYGCGWNATGCLGIGNNTNQPSWVKSPLSTVTVSYIKDMQMACPYHHGSGEVIYGAVYLLRDDGNGGDLYASGSNYYGTNGLSPNTNRFTYLSPEGSTGFSRMEIGCAAGTHFALTSDRKELWVWGNDDLRLWDMAIPSLFGKERHNDWWKGQTEEPNFTYPRTGYYRVYTRFPIIWWPDGTHWYVSDDGWGCAGRGTKDVHVTYNDITPETIARDRVPIAEDEKVIQMTCLNSYYHPTVFALTDKGTLYGVGHNGSDWNDMPSIYNQYKVATNSVWQRLL